MTTITTVNTKEAAKEIAASKTTALKCLIEKSAKELGKALPNHMRPERLVRIALTCIRQNPALSECTTESFLGALFVSAQLGIEPIAGMAYILPYNNKRKIGEEWKTFKEAQFILGYKGLGVLFFRHEKSIQLSWGIVHQNDEFDYEYGTAEKLRHKPVLSNRGPVIAYYVCAKLIGGGTPFIVMSREDCLEHGRKHSKTFDKKTNDFYANSPWKTSEDAMCLKTCLVQLGKLLPLSIEMQRAISVDESSRDFRKGIEDALDVPSSTNWEAEEPKQIENVPVADLKITPKEVILTEHNKHEAWKIISIDGKEFWTGDNDIQYVLQHCVIEKKEFVAALEIRDNKSWIVEIL